MKASPLRVFQYTVIPLIVLGPMLAINFYVHPNWGAGATILTVFAYFGMLGLIWKLVHIEGADFSYSMVARMRALFPRAVRDARAPVLIFRSFTPTRDAYFLQGYIELDLADDSIVSLQILGTQTGKVFTVLEDLELEAGERLVSFEMETLPVDEYNYEVTIAGQTFRGLAYSVMDVSDVPDSRFLQVNGEMRTLDGLLQLTWDICHFGPEDDFRLLLTYNTGTCQLESPLGRGFTLSATLYMEFRSDDTLVMVLNNRRICFTSQNGRLYKPHKGEFGVVYAGENRTLVYVSPEGSQMVFGLEHRNRLYLVEAFSPGRQDLRTYHYHRSGARCRLESINWEGGAIELGYLEDERRLASITKNGERVAKFEYGETGVLSRCLFVDGRFIQFEYQQLAIPGRYLRRVYDESGSIRFFTDYEVSAYLMNSGSGKARLQYARPIVVNNDGTFFQCRFNKGQPIDLDQEMPSKISASAYRHMAGTGLPIERQSEGQRVCYYEWDPDRLVVARSSDAQGVIEQNEYNEFNEEVCRNAGGEVTRTWYHPPEMFDPPYLTSRISAILKPDGTLTRYVCDKDGAYVYQVDVMMDGHLVSLEEPSVST